MRYFSCFNVQVGFTIRLETEFAAANAANFGISIKNGEQKMNLLSKTTPWVVASLITAATAFGQTKSPAQQQSFDQGYAMAPNQFMPAYSAPARIDVRGAWDFYAFAAFTYWQPRQENMELGFVRKILPLPVADLDGNFVQLDFKYKPGFKVGLGMNFDHDNWDACAIYTWFRGRFVKSTCTDGTNQELFPLRGHPAVLNALTQYTEGEEKWSLHMDILDVELARSFYSGTCLTFRPFFGARALWMRQYLRAHYIGTYSSTAATATSVQKVQSWGVGPRVGIYGNWLLGEGFRFIGNASGDILYTRYEKLREHDDAITTTTTDFHAHEDHCDYLRAHLEMEFGFGWGSYFDNNNWHVDLSATYTFQVFFDHNMFRQYLESFIIAPLGAISTCPGGNLYMHGPTATLRFDF